VTRLRVGALVAAVLLASGSPAGAARAQSVADAQAEARAAAERVAAMTPDVERALSAYDTALGSLAEGVSESVEADRTADEAAATVRARHDQASDRVRALYMTGGAAALYASVLDAGSAADAMQRVAYVQRLVAAGSSALSAGERLAEQLRDEAARLEQVADAAAVTAADVQERYEALLRALDRARAEVEALSERARSLAEAQALLAQVAALNAAVDAAGEQRVATARASDHVPSLFRQLYRDAAKTCRGMSWTLLAAIGQVESGHGANPGTSYAGAQGPMQFMPATWAAYGVDADGDGDRDIHDPVDAVYSAANYLCRNGAGRGGNALARAIWHYNHADWYVALVLKLAAQYEQRSP
jgi:peptidoglycan hydrolase CwlO-like protein